MGKLQPSKGNERALRGFQIFSLMQTAIIVLLVGTFWRAPIVNGKTTPQVLRVRGLIVEDQQGRARIVLGAPFPQVPERSRQDATTEAMIFLDPEGHDRLTLGEEPNPQILGKVPSNGHRIAPGFGMLVHDELGNERGAFGWLGNGRTALSIDRKDGDAWAALVDDNNGFAGTLYEFPRSFVRGEAITIGTQGANSFVKFSDAKGEDRLRAGLAAGEPTALGFQLH